MELSEAQGALAAVETEVEVHATQREHLGKALDAKLKRSESRAAELQTSHFASEEAPFSSSTLGGVGPEEAANFTGLVLGWLVNQTIFKN